MTKVFIDVFDCKTPHKIFTGKDALRHALFYVDRGCVCEDANRLFNYYPKLDLVTSWHSSDKFRKPKDFIEGNGCHMKMYFYKENLLLSSQNNTGSDLFEFAILYPEKPNLKSFLIKTFSRAVSYCKWWKENNYYGLKGMKNDY